MKRKLLSWLLVLVTVFSLLPMGAVEAADHNSQEYVPITYDSWRASYLGDNQYYYLKNGVYCPLYSKDNSIYYDYNGTSVQLTSNSYSGTFYRIEDALVTNKTLTRENNGTYTITMSSYARPYTKITKYNWTEDDFNNAEYYYKDGEQFQRLEIVQGTSRMYKDEMVRHVFNLVKNDYESLTKDYDDPVPATHYPNIHTPNYVFALNTDRDCNSAFFDESGPPTRIAGKWFYPTGIYQLKDYSNHNYQLYANYSWVYMSKNSGYSYGFYINLFFSPVWSISTAALNTRLYDYKTHDYRYSTAPTSKSDINLMAPDFVNEQAYLRAFMADYYPGGKAIFGSSENADVYNFGYNIARVVSNKNAITMIGPGTDNYDYGPQSFTGNNMPGFFIETDEHGNPKANAFDGITNESSYYYSVPTTVQTSNGSKVFTFNSSGYLQDESNYNTTSITLYRKSNNYEQLDNLNTQTVLKDILTNQFVFEGDKPTVTVGTQSLYLPGCGHEYPTGTLNAISFNSDYYDPDTRTITIKDTGFDYLANSTTTNSPKKLVVKVSGLKPVTAGTLYSNESGSGIYTQNGDLLALFPVPSIDVPEGDVPQEIVSDPISYLIDFNGKMKLAENGVIRKVKKDDNGTFAVNDGAATYQLKDAGTGIVNQPYSAADSATIKGRFYSTTWKTDENGVFGAVTTAESEPTLRDVTVIPAGSIYYDDNLASETAAAITVGDGSGYNVEIAASPATVNAAKGTYTYTFHGTGIDVYCTTESTGGFIQAKLDGVQANTVSVRNVSDVTRYNVPTISFTGLENKEHTLVLNVLGSSNYKLDGIRIYNAVSDQSLYNETSEQYATFINMRDALVNNKDVYEAFDSKMTADDTNETLPFVGALYIDNKTAVELTEPAINAQTGQPVVDDKGEQVMIKSYTSKFDKYDKNSPKHELYLDQNQAITFQLTDKAQGGQLWIGLSAPNAGAESGTVTINNTTVAVTSAVDMYYPITADMIGESNSVTITNAGTNLISVTNLKVTGVESIYNAANMQQTAAAPESASALSIEDVIPLVFEPVTMQTVKLAANNGVDPDAAVVPTPTPDDPTPTPDDPTQDTLLDLIHQVISAFVRSLFSSISRLFP